MGPSDARRVSARRQGPRSPRADAGPDPAARANVGALAIRAAGGDYHWDRRQAFSSIGALANELIDQIDQERVREVRARVDRKILEQSLPKHLFYEVLHGIRSLTAYDHSAALLTYDDERDALEVVAEQITWQKAKGQNVGRKLPLTPALRERLCRPLSTASTATAEAGATGRAPTRPPWRSSWISTATPNRAAPRPEKGRSSAPPGHPRRAAGSLEGRGHPRRRVQPVRSRAGFPVSPPDGRGPAQRAAGRITRATGADRGAQARDGRPRAGRLTRREQRPGRRPPARPAIARGDRPGDARPGGRRG